MPRKKVSEVIKQFNDAFKEKRDVSQESHDSVMEGFVIPLLEAGLVDDVDQDEEENE